MRPSRPETFLPNDCDRPRFPYQLAPRALGRPHGPAGFSGFRFETHHVVVDGDIAAVHATLHGVHSGVWHGKEPTGTAYSSAHMFFIRFDGDRIAEVWELNDPTGLP